MARRKRQTIIYKALHRNIEIEKHEPHWNPDINSGRLLYFTSPIVLQEQNRKLMVDQKFVPRFVFRISRSLHPILYVGLSLLLACEGYSRNKPYAQNNIYYDTNDYVNSGRINNGLSLFLTYSVYIFQMDSVIWLLISFSIWK